MAHTHTHMWENKYAAHRVLMVIPEGKKPIEIFRSGIPVVFYYSIYH